MITFKQFILEEEKKDLVSYLKNFCQPAVQDIIKADGFLWRGGKPSTEYEIFSVRGEGDAAAAVVTTRKDRRPKDTARFAHDEIDSYFYTKFGLRLRSNTVFCYGHKGPAGAYGKPHVIIPIGQYDIYWSKDVTDLTEKLFPDMEFAEGDGNNGLAGGEDHWKAEGYYPNQVDHEMQEEWIMSFMPTLDYQKGPNDEAMKSKLAELMVACNRYLSFPLVAGFSEDDLMGCVYEAAAE